MKMEKQTYKHRPKERLLLRVMEKIKKKKNMRRA